MTALPAYVALQLRVSSTIARLINPSLTKKQAFALVAREHARVHGKPTPRTASRVAPPVPGPGPVTLDNARATLIARVAGIIQRMADAPVAPPVKPATATPASMSLLDEPTAVSVETGLPVVETPEPVLDPTSPLVQSPYSSGAELIPDSAYVPRFRDQTTANWRKSIEDNIIRLDAQRARSKSRYVG